MKIIFLIIASIAQSAIAFAPSTPSLLLTVEQQQTSSSTALNESDDKENFLRWAKASRSASVNDRVVELKRPLGIVLDEDEEGNVFVAVVAPKGNAARSGMVKKGDVVTMTSATFGDQMWSCRGVGLSRVEAAIRVRAGPTVKLALESTNEKTNKVANTTKNIKAAEEARAKAQAKRDGLLKELEGDNQKLKKKFFGLF